MKLFSTFFLREAAYKGKIVSLDVPFSLRDDPEFTKGVYVQDPDSNETKFVRYGKREKDGKTGGAVGPKADPRTTDTPEEETPPKTSPKYWDDKDKK